MINKKYIKDKKIEISLPSFGQILNQSFINTYLVSAELGYYLNKDWGIHLEFSKAFNNDKPERFCLEHFYNDPLRKVPSSCPSKGDELQDALKDKNGNNFDGASYGPAYLNIREINYLLTANISWNPIYGKQIALLSFTSYFDLYLKAGFGITDSNYYPKVKYLKNNRIARKESLPSNYKGCPPDIGVCPSEPDFENYIGEKGRPDPLELEKISSTISFTFGQKFHFRDSFHIKAELKSYILMNTIEGYESFFAVTAGAGMRI